jgi:hypothetical protein
MRIWSSAQSHDSQFHQPRQQPQFQYPPEDDQSEEQELMTPNARTPSASSFDADHAPSHAHTSSTGSASGGSSKCLSCRKKDLTIKKLTALISNLLEQFDDLALEARGDLTLITSAAAES